MTRKTRPFGTANSRKTKSVKGWRSRPQAFRDINENSPEKLSGNALKRVFKISEFGRIRSIVDSLDMEELRHIFASAESGQLYQLIDLYTRIEATDSRIAGMVNTRRQAASRANYVISSGNEDSAMAEEAADLVRENISRLRWKMFLSDLLDGRFHGVALFEKIWLRSPDGSLYIGDIEQVDHSLIEQYNYVPNSDRYGDIFIRERAFAGDKIFLDEIEPFKIIKAVNTDKDGFHDLSGIMRTVARWFVIKTFLIKGWAQYAETYGFPVPIVTVSKQEFEQNKSQIKTLLESVGVNRYGIFFDTMEYELNNSADQASIAVFEKYLNLANTEMAIAILGQNLTTEIQGGSRAASETHYKVMQALTEDDVEWTDEIVQSQIVDEIVRVNFPSLPIEDYPTYSTEIKRNIDLQQLGMGLQAMSRLVPISKAYIYEQSQIPQPTSDEETVGGNGDSLLSALDTN